MGKQLQKADSLIKVRKWKVQYIPGKSRGLEFKRTRFQPQVSHIEAFNLR